MHAPKLVLSTAIILLANILIPASVLAQTAPTTFNLMPALVEKTINPGDTGQFKMTLTNKSDTTQAVKVYVQNFSAQGIEGQITFGENNTSTYAAADWLTPEQDSLLLEPGAKQEVTVDYTIPLNAEPGGHYASVLFEQVLPDEANKTSHVEVAARLAGLIYLTVSGDIIEAGQILGATSKGGCQAVVCGFAAPSFVDHGPVPFNFIFTNTGNVHVRPKGTITITQFGRQIANIPVEDRVVLPSSQRHFTTLWPRQILLGPYTAKLHLTYGSKNYPLDATTSFWAFPWQIFLALVLIIVAVAAIFVIRKYHHVERLKNKSKS